MSKEEFISEAEAWEREEKRALAEYRRREKFRLVAPWVMAIIQLLLSLAAVTVASH